MSPDEWEQLLLAATERVRRKVSSLAKRGDRGRVLGVGAAGDGTIYADKVAEDEIFRSLRKADPVRILSEEAGTVGDPGTTILAVVDPLDGSSNFARGIPFYCTSVAMVVGGRAKVGVVRDLVSGDAYSAVEAGGARKNGKPIKTSTVTDLSEAVLGADLSRRGGRLGEFLSPLIGGSKRQVHFGANALELCYVAEGKTDAFVDLREKIRVTDMAAGCLIAAEAGAVITQPDGEELKLEYDLSHRLNLVASANRRLHKQILELVQRPPAAR